MLLESLFRDAHDLAGSVRGTDGTCNKLLAKASTKAHAHLHLQDAMRARGWQLMYRKSSFGNEPWLSQAC